MSFEEFEQWWASQFAVLDETPPDAVEVAWAAYVSGLSTGEAKGFAAGIELAATTVLSVRPLETREEVAARIRALGTKEGA